MGDIRFLATAQLASRLDRADERFEKLVVQDLRPDGRNKWKAYQQGIYVNPKLKFGFT